MSHRIAVIALIAGTARLAAAQPEPSPDPAPSATTDDGAPDPGATPDTALPPPAPAPAPADVSATTAAVPPITPPPPVIDDVGFRFGSYGRVLAGSDLRGGTPAPVAVVAHGPRIVEKSYLELDFAYRFATRHGHFKTVATVAWGDRLFHYTGTFDAQPALRNFYGEAELDNGLELWAGSRMYRGDDIYLFDYWPLDDQNTVGAGAAYGKHKLRIAGHAGVNRLENDLQYQTRKVPDPAQGSATVTQLDRQRMVASATATYQLLQPQASNEDDLARQWGATLKVHAELAGLPSGTRLRDDATTERLPRDWGTTIGAELGAWQLGLGAPGSGIGDKRPALRRHLNGFARWSKGLTAFDELAAATSLDANLKTYPHASELVFGLSGGWDADRFNILIGALSRRFVGAGPQTSDPNAGWEYALDARPLARLGGDFYGGADLSFQARFPRGLNATTQQAEDPGVVQIAPMIVYSPLGPSAYDRPQLRLVYRAAHLNQGALDLYVPDDPRHNRPWVHFLGVQAEWWFNSSSYH
jgi:maltoporin